MQDEDLTTLLGGRKADPKELAAVLLSWFGFSQGSGLEYRYGPEGKPPRIVVQYDKKGEITRILRGHGLAASDIDDLRVLIARDAIGRANRQVGRRILFSARPLKGWFRYGDHIQILPVPADAPQSHLSHMMHPFVLEVSFPHSADPAVATNRQYDAVREATLLLSTFVGMGISARAPTSPSVWVMDPNNPSGPSFQTQQLYHWPEFRGRADDFADVEGQPSAALEPLRDSFGRHGGVPLDGALPIPDALPALFDLFFKLSPDDRRRYLRAAYWLDHVQQVWALSSTAAYLAASRAIEAMLPEPPPATACGKCDRTFPASIRISFERFVTRLSIGSVPPQVLGKFYGLRSRLTHGGDLFESDEVSGFGGPVAMRQQGDLMTVTSVARAVLINWLLLRESGRTQAQSDNLATEPK